MTRQSAHERYASFEREMRAALLFPDRGETAVSAGLQTRRTLDETAP